MDLKQITDNLIADIDKEIYELDDLLGTITSEDSIKDFEIEDIDLKVMRSRLSAFKDAKRMVEKASFDLGRVDETIVMTNTERKLYFKLIKLIFFYKRILRIFKRK